MHKTMIITIAMISGAIIKFSLVHLLTSDKNLTFDLIDMRSIHIVSSKIDHWQNYSRGSYDGK